MKNLIVSFLISLVFSIPGIAQDNVTALSGSFRNPPQELASHVIWGWEGDMDIATMRHDLDSIKAKGFRSVIFEAGYHLPFEYLSEGWFKAIRTAVLEAKARGLKVWIIDEGKYPSGFAGGKFTRERPDLRMKALVVADTLKVERGTILSGVEVPGHILAGVAVSRSGSPDRAVPVKDGRLDFFAGNESWDILLVRWDYRTGDTRAVNNPTGGKDRNNSQSDYLSHEAVRQFIDWTHEQYKKYIGDEFGKTVLGFRGDEPDFSYLPWTPDIAAQFEARKGYDPSPYLGLLLGRNPSPEAKFFRADYWDVWSDLFALNFFKQQADWCGQNGISYVTHLNKDHDMPECIRVEGDPFRDLSKIQIPGVDAIWNQIWPGTVNDFPKFASSVSHVYGKRRAFSESFAAYSTPPTIPTATYAVNYQMVRGINFFEFMFWLAGSKSENWMSDPRMKALNDYTNRMTYMLGLGRPGARIAVYYPTSTFWMGDRSVNDDLVKTAQLLLTHQRDFDWVDDNAFAEALTVGTGYMENLSGQRYYTLVIPSSNAISETAWKKIEDFSRRGGKVLFWGRKPTMLTGRSFMEPAPVPRLSRNVFEEPTMAWTRAVEASMPEPEFALVSGETPHVSYIRRVMDDREIYLVFNEGDDPCSFTARFAFSGKVLEWNAYDGTSKPLAARKEGPCTVLDMSLGPWEANLISIERGQGTYNVRKSGVRGNGKVETASIQAVIDRAYAEGGGTVVFPAGKYLSGALFFPAGVNLRVEKNAVLKGTADPDDYPLIKTRFEGYDREWRCAFLNFDHSAGVTVSGEGTIDGTGLSLRHAELDLSGLEFIVDEGESIITNQ